MLQLTKFTCQFPPKDRYFPTCLHYFDKLFWATKISNLQNPHLTSPLFPWSAQRPTHLAQLLLLTQTKTKKRADVISYFSHAKKCKPVTYARTTSSPPPDYYIFAAPYLLYLYITNFCTNLHVGPAIWPIIYLDQQT